MEIAVNLWRVLDPKGETMRIEYSINHKNRCFYKYFKIWVFLKIYKGIKVYGIS